MSALRTIWRLLLFYFAHDPLAKAGVVKQVPARRFHNNCFIREIIKANGTDVFVLGGGLARSRWVRLKVLDLVDDIFVSVLPLLFPFLEFLEGRGFSLLV